MTEGLKNHLISPIMEESTRQSERSNGTHGSFTSKRGASVKSQTYSRADRDHIAAASIHSYSEIYESRTRESIDETSDNINS